MEDSQCQYLDHTQIRNGDRGVDLPSRSHYSSIETACCLDYLSHEIHFHLISNLVRTAPMLLQPPYF
ncbi:hypothetical protein BLNAU_22274 [Blattamonas nauphoetae]|uniref:Uncharacterized protein n=1 Tax=Blattamonas nauphoetae TaxID=2049346 RepID=A0ABQ9WTH6_9EUKA|nr:hypothetical protein BLNAU_22274 [Blattamonas nauphoetae]